MWCFRGILREMLPIPIPGKKFFCSKRFKKVTHCLFDLDGTILDSERMYHKVIATICDRYGKSYTKEIQVTCAGVTERHMAETVVQQLKLPITVDKFEREMLYMVGKSLGTAAMIPGAERLLQHLHINHVPMAIATNSSDQSVRLHVTARPKLFGLFEHLVTASDPEVDRGKPFPDIYLVAASRFTQKPKPDKCIVFEDSEVGVKAGKEAGMQVVMIATPGIDRSRTQEATLVIRSLHHFEPELFGLPPFADKPAKT